MTSFIQILSNLLISILSIFGSFEAPAPAPAPRVEVMIEAPTLPAPVLEAPIALYDEGSIVSPADEVPTGEIMIEAPSIEAPVMIEAVEIEMPVLTD